MKRIFIIFILSFVSFWAQSQTISPRTTSYYWFDMATFGARGLDQYFGENIPAHSIIVDSWYRVFFTTEAIEIGEYYPNNKMYELPDLMFMRVMSKFIGEALSSTDTVTVNQQQ